MNIKKYASVFLWAVVLLSCVFIAHATVLYTNPQLNTGIANFIFSVCIYAIFAIGAGYTLYLILKYNRENSFTDEVTEQTYRNILEGSGVTSIVVNRYGVITFISDNIERLCGFEAASLTGAVLIECLPIAFRPDVQKIIAGIGHKEVYDDTIEVQIFTFWKEAKWVSCRVYPIKGKNGLTTSVQLMVHDIDKEKKLKLELEKTELAAKKHQKLFQTILDYCPALIYLKKPTGEFVLTNSKMKQVAGVKTEGELDVAIMKAMTGAQKKLHDEQEAVLLAEKRMIAFEDSFELPNGKTAYYWVMKFPLLDDNGEVEYICNLSTDITSLKQSEQIIIDSVRESEEAQIAQETFLASISHELRTPMNGILGMSNLLIATSLNEEQRENIDAIQESAKNLLALINDLLDFSKIKAGKFNLEIIEFKPRQSIKKAMYPLLFRANEKGLPLKCFIDTSVPDILKGDPLRLQQVIINLVANAIKFTEKGYVEVKVYPGARAGSRIMLKIDVIDTGIGIAPDKLDRVFESYIQSDTNISRIYGGTGLGLAIVKQLVELQKGTVSVKSELGKGATFSVEIPFEADEKAIEGTGHLTIDPQQKNLLKDIHVLVAEDNLINQKVVKQTLQRQMANVVIASNGRIAIEELENYPFDIILMDLQMPEMDGYTATRHIRDVMHNYIPIVAMTADALKGESDKCFEIGMDDYISKPFEPLDLYEKILHLVHKN